MSADVESIAPTVLIAEARVRHSERLSPAFVRVTLESPAYEDLGIDGFDTRFKIVFPGATGELPKIPTKPENWYADWKATPDETRSPMRTYTVRDVAEDDGVRTLVVDLVVHEHGPQGPACRWALAARPGDMVHVIAPHRASREYGGTEFAPGERRDLLLVADETALPALTRIITDVPGGLHGARRCRGSLGRGHPCLRRTRQHRGDVAYARGRRARAPLGRGGTPRARPRRPGPDRPACRAAQRPGRGGWETPRYSSSGEDVSAQLQRPTVGSDLNDLYAWIAGESWLVKALRRSLVTELGVDRAQVAFMGYWRQGVSMRS